jgi:hypothetical protein
VKGKRREAVDKLMLDLYNLGYRLAHWEYNNGDKHCVEISMVNVHLHSGEKVAKKVIPTQKYFSLGKIPIDAYPTLGSLTADSAIPDTVVVYNGFPFHNEMYGYLIYYCLFYRRPIIIYTVMTKKLLFGGWVEFYKSYFQDPYRLITWKDFQSYEHDRHKYKHNMIVVVTDDDPMFKPQWVTNLTLTIDHWYENRAPHFHHHLAIRPFPTSRYIENQKVNPKERIQLQQRSYAFPTFPVISAAEKLQILSGIPLDTINVVIAGGEKYDYNIFNRLKIIPPDCSEDAIIPAITLHVIARSYDPIYHEKHLIKDHLKLVLYSDVSATEMSQIVARAHFILTDAHITKPSHMEGLSMTASIPMSFNYFARLIISTKSNALYQFKDVVEFDLDGSANILLDVQRDTIVATTKRINQYREEQVRFFHHYMNHFPFDVPMKNTAECEEPLPFKSVRR